MSDRAKNFVNGKNLKVYNHDRKGLGKAEKLARRKARLQQIKKWSALGAKTVKTVASVVLGGGPKLQININIGGKNNQTAHHQPNNNNQHNVAAMAAKKKMASR